MGSHEVPWRWNCHCRADFAKGSLVKTRRGRGGTEPGANQPREDSTNQGSAQGPPEGFGVGDIESVSPRIASFSTC
jgi:hypothetical protein